MNKKTPASLAVRIFIFSALIYASCLSNLSARNIRVYDIPGRGKVRAVEDEILVKFREDVPAEERILKHSQRGGGVFRRLSAIDVEVVKLPPGLMKKALREYLESPLVEYAEPNYIYSGFQTLPGEYTSVGSMESNQWGLVQVEAHYAWDIETGGEAVIAILDSGIQIDHPDLASNIIPGRDFVDDNNDPGTSDEGVSHGTHVAGIAGAAEGTGPAGSAVVGTAWSNSIMPLRVLNDNLESPLDRVAAAVLYAAENGADIINLSLGGGFQNQTLEDAVNSAFNDGCLLVAASGNDGGADNIKYPAAYENVMAVGASDTNDARAPLSDYGYKLDLVAPGMGIYSTVPDKTHDSFNGTSMAAPFVSGAASLAVSYCERNDIDWGPQMLRDIINLTADGSGFNPETGYGRLNAYEVLSYLSPPLLEQPAEGALVNSIGLVWREKTYAQEYDIEVHKGTRTYSETVTDNQAVFEELDDGEYGWRVRSRYECGYLSGWSDTRNFTLDTTPPVDMVLELLDVKGSRVLLSASAKDYLSGINQEGYRFRMSTSPETGVFKRDSGWVSEDVYEWTELTPGVTYWFRFAARDRVENSAWSSTVSARTAEVYESDFTEKVYSPETNEKFALVEVEAGAYDFPVRLEVSELSEFQKTRVAAADSRLPPGTRRNIIPLMNYAVLDGEDNAAGPALEAGFISLRFYYPGGFSVPETQRLRIARLDEAPGIWRNLDDILVNPGEGWIEAGVSELSVYALLLYPEDYEGELYVYPNPFKPGDREYGAAEGRGVMIYGVSSPSEIRVFNVSGELVDSFSHYGDRESLLWEGAGDAASGVYIILINSRGRNRSIIFSIVR